MTLSTQDLEKVAQLACLETNECSVSKLEEEINAIMDFVDALRTVNTDGVAPLFHPLALQQRLRTDTVSEEECLAELEAIAPLFDDNLYLVPKVLDSGK